jgi:hypothetical protein
MGKSTSVVSPFADAPLLMGLFAFVFVSPAQAGYLDPGSASLVFQLLIAFVVSALFSLKLYWRRIRARFTTRVPPSNPENLRTPDDDANKTP